MASKAPKDGEAFEVLYGRLEQTVSRLEDGGLTLEESIALYEDGMKLARRCQEMLQQAELRITRLQESFSEGLGELREELETYEPPPDSEVPVGEDEPPE